MPRTIDRFELMRLLVRVAETGSLSAAGRSLGLSQPSASRQLKILERELGAQLVMRTTHELAFTEAGEDFLSEARQMLAAWDAAAEQANTGSEKLQGRIRIAAAMGMGQTVLADLAGSFVAQHQGISLDWILIDEPRDMIAEGIDLWIRVGPVRDESLIVRRIWTIERALVSAREEDASATHPSDLSTAPAIILAPYVGARIDLTGPEGETYSLEPLSRIRTDNIFAAERLTRSQRGYSILPLWLIDEALENGALDIICQGWRPPELSLSVAYPQSRFRPARVKAFVDFLRSELPVFGRGIKAS